MNERRAGFIGIFFECLLSLLNGGHDVEQDKLTRKLAKQTKANVASVINNLLSPFMFSSNLRRKLILCALLT